MGRGNIRMKYERFLNIASSLAQKASEEITKLLKNPTIRRRKEDHSIVTEADLRSDEIIRKGLAQNFPDHAILTEETGLTGDPQSEFVWMVDPLDGTKAYARGTPGFCVMIGLLKEGKPYLGVIVDPLEGHVYEAVKGEGAYHQLQGERKKVHVSTRNNLKEMPLALSTDFPKSLFEKIQQILPCPILEPINSVGIKVALLLRQIGDLYINHHKVSYWDTCAPQIILEEAGGTFTSLDGTPFDYTLHSSFTHSKPTLASNGALHEKLIKLLAEISFS
jgi:3'(2'),5'-bisphosphate nucleotidase